MPKTSFHTVKEISCWRPFVLDGIKYDLSHLNAHEVEYTEERKDNSPIKYKFIVTYSFHCFADDKQKNLSEEEKHKLMYHAPKDSRPFDFKRYNLSFQLPKIISSLGDEGVSCFHADHGNYATYRIDDKKENAINYRVVFKAFRDEKKLRLHVVSAFPPIKEYGEKKIKFLVIAYNLLKGKPSKKPS
jgi:hypothetical protein